MSTAATGRRPRLTRLAFVLAAISDGRKTQTVKYVIPARYYGRRLVIRQAG